MNSPFVCVALYFVLPVCIVAIHADTLSAHLDPSKFGDLDQHLVSACTDPITLVSYSCGPTTAVNSFVYLENAFPNVYNNSLVDLSGLFTKTQAEVMAANDLSFFMGCTPCNHGTLFPQFVQGKEDYIEQVAPGSTTFTQSNLPTAEFIADALTSNADIEAIFRIGSGNAHYVTITGITYDTVLEMGFLTYIDPEDGMLHAAPIHGNGGQPGLLIDYISPTNGAEFPDSQFFGAVTELPAGAPECATLFEVIAGVLCCGLWAHHIGRREIFTVRN